MLEVINLSSGYYDEKGYTKILTDINMHIDDNEIVGILGPNGSGKTTLIKSILGDIYSTGDVIYNDKHAFKKENYYDYRNDIVYVKQDSFNSLKPLKTIESQIGKLYGWKSFDKDYVKSIFTELNLDASVLDMKALQLSDGMRHRVVIAMAVLKNPKILMLDEPTTGLDSISTYKFLKLLKSLKNKSSIIISSNDVNSLFEICDRIYILYNGTIIEDGNYKDILNSRMHPYTDMLLKYIPSYDERNSVFKKVDNGRSAGCVFINSCPYMKDECSSKIDYKRIDEHGYRCIRYPEWKNDKT